MQVGDRRKTEKEKEREEVVVLFELQPAGPAQTHLSYSAPCTAVRQTDNQRALGLPNEDHLHWQAGPLFH